MVARRLASIALVGQPHTDGRRVTDGSHRPLRGQGGGNRSQREDEQ
jgi:hypothetical protein